MAWTTPLTAVSNATLTAAQWNASVRDNFLTTFPAIATAAGQVAVSTGVNAIAARVPSATHIAATCTATSVATYGAPTGLAGPVVGPVTTGATAIVAVAALIQNSTAGAGGSMSYAVTGATTLAAVDDWSTQARPASAGANARHSSLYFHSSATTPLTPGANTFTCQYTTPTGGTATFAHRHLFVFPM